jgi:hypothetical protein
VFDQIVLDGGDFFHTIKLAVWVWHEPLSLNYKAIAGFDILWEFAICCGRNIGGIQCLTFHQIGNDETKKTSALARALASYSALGLHPKI